MIFLKITNVFHVWTRMVRAHVFVCTTFATTGMIRQKKSPRQIVCGILIGGICGMSTGVTFPLSTPWLISECLPTLINPPHKLFEDFEENCTCSR